MQLKEYLKKNNLTVSQFAVNCGMSYHVIYQCFRGQTPHLANCCKIVKATNGEVQYEDLLIIPENATNEV